MTPADARYLQARRLAYAAIAEIERETLEGLNRRFHEIYGFQSCVGNASWLRNVLELHEIHAKHKALVELGPDVVIEERGGL